MVATLSSHIVQHRSYRCLYDWAYPNCAGGVAQVFFLNRSLSQQRLQKLSFEKGIANNVFIWSNNNHFKLAFHSPQAKINRCGIGLLSACNAIADCYNINNSFIVSTDFDSAISCRSQSKNVATIELPIAKLTQQKAPWFLHHKFIYYSSKGYIVLPVATSDIVEQFALTPIIRSYIGDNALIVCCSLGASSVAMRYFAPLYGYDEDLANASSATVIASYFANKFKTSKIKVLQLSRTKACYYYKRCDNKVRISANVQQLS